MKVNKDMMLYREDLKKLGKKVKIEEEAGLVVGFSLLFGFLVVIMAIIVY